MRETSLVLSEIRRAVNSIDKNKILKLVDEIAYSKSVSIIGSGRSGYIGKSFEMRLRHLGLKKGSDLLIVISGSGETKETLRLLSRKKKSKIACLTMNSKSRIAKNSNLIIDVKAKKSRQPLRSLFEQTVLICLDAVVMMLMEKLKVNEKEMWKRHK